MKSPWDNFEVHDGRGGSNRPGGGPGGPRWERWLIALAAFLGGALLIWGLSAAFPDVLGSEDNRMRLVYLTALLAVLVLLGAGSRIQSLKKVGSHLAIWIGIGLVIALGYSFRGELGFVGDRLATNFDPSGPRETQGGEIIFSAARDGHFYIRAEVEGTPVRFMVDTGASDIVLSPDDARRIGLAPSQLSYTQPYMTANGIGYGAKVRLHWMAVGPIELRDVSVSVNQAEMGTSLLGMAFLRQLSSWRVEGDQLILNP